MTSPSHRTGLRGLLLALLLLFVALAFVDLLRPGSVLQSVWEDLFGPRSFIRGFLDDLEGNWPRWRR